MKNKKNLCTARNAVKAIKMVSASNSEWERKSFICNSNSAALILFCYFCWPLLLFLLIFFFIERLHDVNNIFIFIANSNAYFVHLCLCLLLRNLMILFNSSVSLSFSFCFCSYQTAAVTANASASN